MRTAIIASLLLAFLASMANATDGRPNPYQQPAKPVDFSAHAIVLPARKIGDTVIRAQNRLAVEIKVRVEDYLPRDLEPTLFLGGVPVQGPTWVSGTEGNVTTLSFVVERPELLKEGAEIAVQTGDEKTRARVPGALQLDRIKPLGAEDARRQNVPSLGDWLKGGR